MKSPITGKPMILKQERRSMDFRKETFELVFHYYLCEDSGEQFTTTALDEVNMNQVYNQYRDKFNIPFPEDIQQIREQYGLSAAKMSEILGFGINTYRQYEAGEIPSVANAKLIQMAEDPAKFLEMLEWCNTLEEKHKTKYQHKANGLLEQRKQAASSDSFRAYLLGNAMADIYSGYRHPNLAKFTEMVVYFSDTLKPFKTKMNKLLFYADFLLFKESCFSMSGMRYKAIDMGPVPTNFQSLFEYLSNQQHIEIITTEFPQGYIGEQFVAHKERPFNAALFSEHELATLEKVATTFKDTSTKDMIEISHKEDAWLQHEKGKEGISYVYAFGLKGI